MRLVVEKAAADRLNDLPRRQRDNLFDRLRAIAADPFGRHANVRPLRGAKDAFRLRIGDWRVIYRIDRQAQTMHVRMVEPRGSVYR
jgi:mRNA interferase RelE/StbE